MDERPDTTPSVPARPRPSLDPGAQIDRALIELRRELGLASIVDADSSAFGDSDFDADAVIASVAGHPAPVVGTDPPVPITVEPAVDPIAAAPRASPAATAPAAPAPHAVPSRHETPAPAARTAPAAHAQTAPDPPAAPVPQHAPARSEPSRPARVRAPSTTASQPAYARAPSQPAVPSLRSNPAVAGSAIPPIALAVARARVVLIRFAAGEPLPEATTRWVLRMFAAIMLEHGLLEDARIERALARIGDPPVEG